MDQQNAVAAQTTPAAAQVQNHHLVERVAQLEAEVAELKTLIYRFALTQAYPPVREGYAWIKPPSHLQGLTDYAQITPEDLVYIHELTDEEVRRRLDELEQWYGMSSAEFYRRWQSGVVDDIFEKTEWHMLYELWLQIQAQSTQLEKVVA